MKLHGMITAARVLMVAALLLANSPLPALAASANTEEPPPPAFDDFGTPIIISSLPYTTTQSVQFATVAGDDPLIPNGCWPFENNTGYRTVWFKYIPAQNAQLTVDTHDSDYDTVLTVWTGTRGSLVNRACNDDDNLPYPPTSLVSLAVTAGTTYYIEVASYNSETGNSLSLHASVPANPPGAFNKSSPANAATGVSASPTLGWGTSANATSYEYCLDFSNDNTCASSWTTTGTNTSVALSGLATSSTYYWQVRARNTDGTTEANGGTWWSFTTQGSGNNDDFITPLVVSSFPYTNTQSVGAYTTASNDPVLTCMDFTDARYKTAWYSYTAGSSGTLTLDTSTSTYDTLLAVWTGSLGSLVSVGCNDDVDLVDTWSYLALSVSAGTTYYIEVASVEDTSSISLTLNADRVLIPPGAFGKTSPTNGATGISFTPTLSWAGSSGATSYEYCYDATNDGACSAWTSSGASTSAGISGLSPSTTYYWQVRAINGDGTTYADGSATAFWSFSTSASGNNDEFISPVVISSLAYTNTQSVSGYTTAVDDPLLPCSSSQKRSLTAWYRYTPGQNRQLNVDTFTSNYDTVLAIWTGTQGSLVNIGCNDDSGGSQSSLSVSVSAGTAYFIEIASVTAAPPTPSLVIHASTVSNPPGAFSKSSPVNGGTGISASPTLSWGASANALSYDYCIDTTNDNACSEWISSGASTSASLSGLATSSTYYWHVRAVNEDGTTYANGSTTSFWSFSTAPSGNNDDFITPVSISSLPFTNSQGVSGYTTASDDPLYTCPVSQPFFFTAWYRYIPGQNRQLILDTFTSTYDTVLAVYTGNQGSLTSLACNDNYGGNQSRVELAVTAGTTYYIEVASYDEVPAGTTLVVHASTVPNPPGAFSRVSPVDEATNQPTNPTLTWGVSSAATSYEYCYDTTNDNTCSGWTGNGSSTSKALSGLSEGTTYYWHVRAVNEDGNTYAGGSTTAYWSFTTVPPAPGTFNKTSPADAATNVSLAPTLIWNSSSGAISYEYCYDTSNDSACAGSWTSVGANTSVSLSGLTTSTTYYWQVRAINPSGTTYANAGAWWSFTTVPPAPGAFNKTSPTNAAINVSLSPTLIWNSSSGAVTYDYCYDTSDNNTCNNAWISAAGSTSVTLSSLNTSTTYYWQVRAVNPGGTTYANVGAWWSFTTVPSAPGAFNKSAPANAASNVSLTPTLSWASSSGAISYELCYDTSGNSACDGSWIPTGSTTSATISGLTTSTTYYWQARAINPGGTTYADNGTWWSFTTVPAAPGAFAKTSPANAAVNIALAPTLTWGSSTGVISYQYCYDTSNDSACAGSWISAGSTTSVVLGSLTTSTTYYWQVRAVNPGGTTYANLGAWWSFTTVPPAPGAFGKTSPANAATSQPTSLTLTWEASTGATSYEYCYDTSGDNACSAWTSNGTSTSKALSGLSEGTTYYWHVRAVNAGGTTYANSASTAFWSFTTLVTPPGAFNKTSPTNGATGLSTSPTLTWSPSSGAASYEYCYDTTGDNDCSSWTSNGAATTKTLNGLSEGTIYYWHVRAINAGGITYANGAATSFWSFTTGVSLPGAFNKSSPVDGASGQSTSLTLTWGASSGASSYEYCYDTSNNNSCDGTWIPTGTNTSIGISGLSSGTTYYWQVKAKNAGGETYANGGTWWSFSTMPPAPGAFSKTAPVNGATSVSTNPTLTWGTSTGATEYEYCYDTTNDSACSSWTSTGTNTSANLSGLSSATTYYWHVRAINAGGTTYAGGSATAYWSFTTSASTTPPGAFNKTSPTNSAVGVPTTAVLSWGASSGATSYDFCVDKVDNGTCDTSWVSAGNSTSGSPSGLSKGTKYFWQVRAVNTGGNTTSDGGTWWNFTTPSSFSDVSDSYWALTWIERLYNSGITTGCGGGQYCPENQVTRAQMAVFLIRGTHGVSFVPPAPTGIFNDVPTTAWAANYIEQLYADGITTGCNPALMLFCPAGTVTRAQMAAFLLRAKYGKDFKPDPATGIFSDVPTTHWAAAWIEKLSIDGITTGCGGGKYCPEDPVTRAQMAVFLVRTFNLP